MKQMWSVYVNFIVIITLLQVLYYMKISHNWLSVAFHMSVFPCRFETHRHTLTRMQTTSLLYYHYHLLVMTSLSCSFYVFNYQSSFSKITTPNSNNNNHNNSDQITDGQIDKTYTLKYTDCLPCVHISANHATHANTQTHTHTHPLFVQ